MDHIPIAPGVIDNLSTATGITNPGKASIRQIVTLVDLIEQQTGICFIRMEMGVPGLDPPEIAVNAEIEALKSGVASKYAPIEGIPELKNEASRFIKLFLDIDINASGCIPTIGSMEGSFITFATINRTDPVKNNTLFIDPGFPVHKHQCLVIGHGYQAFDIYNYRGSKLRDKLAFYFKTGKISSILYSNPNNPSWICLTDEELQIIGELATEYDVIVLEDLAYFGMDFRKDYSIPGVQPFQPTVARYTDNYILFISTSKIFSYAGQRIGILAVSNKLFNRKYPHLKQYYTSDSLGHNLVYGSLYVISAGVTHSAQYAAAALLEAVNEKRHPLLDDVLEYGMRAKQMKKMFTTHGFDIVYDSDGDVPLADGFYFTLSYPGFTGAELLKELLHYGISAISLEITGSSRIEGLRACVSQISPDLFPVLDERLKLFNTDHS